MSFNDDPRANYLTRLSIELLHYVFGYHRPSFQPIENLKQTFLTDTITYFAFCVLRRIKKNAHFITRTSAGSVRVIINNYLIFPATPADLGINIESKEIPDNQITASTYFDSNHAPHMGRLNYPFGAHAWCAANKDTNQWLKFDLGYTMLVTGIVTQSKGYGYPQWVTTYKISYSLDNSNWAYYRDDEQTFTGNSDETGYVTNTFKGDIKARFVRIHPVTWHLAGDHICMRATAIGRRKDSFGVCSKYHSILADSRLTSASTSYVNDDSSLDESSWYIFKDKQGFNRILTTCVPKNRCGAIAPGYMQGALPTVNEGIVKRKVCVHSNGDCCHNSVYIYVRNCYRFYVYNLKKLDLSWKARYCAEHYING
ncbi:hypothetical protein QZH41_012843, partial [Actinostola sp. cb2023]